MLPRVLLACLALVVASVGCKGPDASTSASQRKPQSPLAALPPAAFTSFATSNAVPAQWLKPSADAFTIGPGDVLEIETLGETNLQTTVTVGPDGKIYYSLLPGTFVWGLTVSQIKASLEDQLAKFLVIKPEVGVSIKTAISQRVWMLGEVTTPGIYPLYVPMTLLEAISIAGGPSTNHLSESFVLRRGQRIPVDLEKLLERGDLSQNIYLQPDDFVYLQTTKSHEIYVIGGVTVPTAVPFSRGISLATAIAYAGGPIPYASMSQVAILRGSLTRPSIATVNFNEIRQGVIADVELEPGDLVYVPMSTFYRLEMLFNQVLDTFVRTVAVNEGQNAVVSDRPGIVPTVPVIPVGP